MKDVKGKKEKIQVNQPVTYYLEEGYDAKKDRKTMNAVNVEIKN